MSLNALLRRGRNLVKVGKAVHALRKASGDDTRQWAKHYLVELLGNSRGLPTKIGQFMTLGSGDDELRETLNTALQPMPFEQVEEVLNQAYQKPYQSIFRTLEPNGKPASLGQVHMGQLKNGGVEVAVKAQYPEIAKAVEAEMGILGWMPKVGPIAKWSFQMDGYRDAFWNNLDRELNYLKEAELQTRYRDYVEPLKEVVVPEVFAEHCRPNVLVQSREEGIDLDKAETLGQTQRQAIGRVALKHYIHMLFRHGFVHADPNPGNFAFRQKGRDQFELILYDYGSVLEISDSVRLALLKTILALKRHEPVDPLACLAAMGFDPDKLADLRSALPALLEILFEPFAQDAPFDVKTWRMSERFDNMVGDLKWWFRSAAPPELIFLMRTLHGLTNLLDRLDAKLSWGFYLEELCSDLFPQARELELPEINVAGPAVTFKEVARYLQVHVVKPNGTKIKLTMPARVADDLEGVIDPPVLESIQRQKIDLDAIQQRLRKSAFAPQLVFDLKDPEREVRVWLE